jgi:Ca2+-transporting ATPase
MASILCNDTMIVDGQTKGDPTETAFVEYYMKSHRRLRHPSKGSIQGSPSLPFDSDRKLMSTLHHIDGKYVMYTKGAIDVIFSRASNLSEGRTSGKSPGRNYRLSNEGLRVLGFAKREFDDMRSPDS